MKKRNLVMVVLAIITMGLAMPLSAQSSNQSTATAGVFGTDADSFMDVNYYGDVEFNKWFGYLGSGPSLGYATKFGDIYLGGYYTGNIFRSGTSETKRQRTTWDYTLQQLLTKEDNTTYGTGNSATTTTTNRIVALIGVAGMGIKVGFYENVTTYNTPYNTTRNTQSTVTQNADGSIAYTNNDSINYEQSSGDIMPYFKWGMKLPMGSGTLAPRVGADFNFRRDVLIDEYYTSARVLINGTNINAEQISRVENNQGYVGLNISAGADYYFNDNFYVGIDYTLGTNLYSNDYSGAGKSGSVGGTANTTAVSSTTNYFNRTVKSKELTLSATERSNMTHNITPTLWKTSNIGDDLQFGVVFSLPVSISNNTTNGYTDYWSISETTYIDENFSSNNSTTIQERHTYGSKVETSNFRIAPSVGIGASYNLIPGRFTINAGVTLDPIVYSNTSTVTSQNGVSTNYYRTDTGSGSNKYTSSETKTVTPPNPVEDTVQNVTSWTGFSGYLSGGFVFSFNDNVALDMVASSSTAFAFNITSLNVKFTFKF